MLDHHLIHLLRTFNRKEMTRFWEFSLSPYHHKHVETQQLITYLNKCYPEFTDSNCCRASLWAKLFPDQDFDNAKLAVLFTYAWRLAEQFLVQEQLAGSQLRESWLLEALRQHRQWQAYERQWRKSKREQEKIKTRDTQYYRTAIAFAEEANQYFLLRENREQDNSLVEKEHVLDQYYVLEKLRYALELQVRRQILQGDYSARLLEGVLEELRQNAAAYAAAPAIQVYFHLYQMMAQSTLEAYRSALAVFQENEDRFQWPEVAAIYNYLQNFCIACINRNQTVFLREIFRLYNEQLARQLLHEDGYLIEWHYKNIVTTALRLGEQDWANEFIETQRTALAPAAAENTYRFSKAAYCHAVGDYGQVLELLTRVEYSDLRYNLGAKALLLRTYYELHEFDALHALVESFRQYLQRNRLMADSRRSGYYHLFRLTRRVAGLRAQAGYIPQERAALSLDKIRQDVAQTDAIFNRAWLEQKIAEIALEITSLPGR